MINALMANLRHTREEAYQLSLMRFPNATYRGQPMEAYFSMIWYLLSQNDQTIHTLQTLLNQAVEALKFYADPETYETSGHSQIDGDTRPINKDRGRLAREILQKLPEDICQ